MVDFIDVVIICIILLGFIFLGIIFILFVFVVGFGVNIVFVMFFGGILLLILVVVVFDILQQIESYLFMCCYDGFVKFGKIQGWSCMQGIGVNM